MATPPVFLPEKSYGQSSLVGYTVYGYKTGRHDLATKQQQYMMPFPSPMHESEK